MLYQIYHLFAGEIIDGAERTIHYSDVIMHGSVSNHQPHDCLLNRLFKRRSKKTLKLRVTGLCAGTGELPAQMVSYEENVPIWWRHNVVF